MNTPRFDDTQPNRTPQDADDFGAQAGAPGGDFYSDPNAADYAPSGDDFGQTGAYDGAPVEGYPYDDGTYAGDAYAGGYTQEGYDQEGYTYPDGYGEYGEGSPYAGEYQDGAYAEGYYTDADGYAWQEGQAAPVYDGYAPAPKRTRWWLWALGGVFLLIVSLVLGGGLGYFSGIQERIKAQSVQIQGTLEEQYNLAMADMAEGRYSNAQQRLEYVVKNMADYPGAADKLTEVKTILSMTQSVPGATQPPIVLLPGETPTPSPTPDLRNAEQMLQSAKTAMAGKDWTNAIEILLKLRKDAPDYESVRVDGLLYICYRNRGIAKVVNSELEGGTYDFALAERYGPLDAEAQNYRDWVNFYTIGASFWDLDWGQAAQYFGQVANLAPQLRDSSGLSAIQRYQSALGNYGDQLARDGNVCEAEEQYNIAIQAGRADIQPTAQYVHDLCSPPEATPAPPEETAPEETAPEEPAPEEPTQETQE